MRSMQTPNTTPSPRVAIRPARHYAAPAVLTPDLADLARINIREICALTGYGEQTIRDKIKAGTFPAADFRDGPRCVRWSTGSVRRWLEATSIQGVE